MRENQYIRIDDARVYKGFYSRDDLSNKTGRSYLYYGIYYSASLLTLTITLTRILAA